MKRYQTVLVCLLTLGAYLCLAPTDLVYAAEETSHEGHDHEGHDHEGHDHEGHGDEDFDYLYGNHTCPVCADADAVDPHFFADVKNKKAGIYGRIYVCAAACAKEIEKSMGKYYMSVYRTDKKTGKKIPPRDLKNQKCPISGGKIDSKTSIEYNGMVVHFCCDDCVESFLKDPEPAMAKLLPEAKEFKFEGDSDHEGHDHEGHDHK